MSDDTELVRLLKAVMRFVDRHAERKHGPGVIEVPLLPQEMYELRAALEPFRGLVREAEIQRRPTVEEIVARASANQRSAPATKELSMRVTEQWLTDHRDYPHDYCLIWPFARESRVGRGMMGDDTHKRKWAHRCMCELIHGPAPADKPQAAHSCGNGDQGCVNPRHLSWATNSENQLHRYAQGKGNPNSRGNRQRFTPEQIEKIRSQWGEFTQVKLAEMYGCSLGTIQYYLKYREERGHAGGKIVHWTPDEDDQIRDGVRRGLNFPQMAREIGRSVSSTMARTYRLGLKSGTPPIQSRSLTASNGTREGAT